MLRRSGFNLLSFTEWFPRSDEPLQPEAFEVPLAEIQILTLTIRSEFRSLPICGVWTRRAVRLFGLTRNHLFVAHGWHSAPSGHSAPARVVLV